jgi:hypothetical protein
MGEWTADVGAVEAAGDDAFGTFTAWGETATYGDEKVANRDTKVWHGAAEKGPRMMGESKTPPPIWDRAAI